MMDLAQSREPFAVPDDSADENDTPTAIQAEGTTDMSPQAQRKRVNRMLKLMHRKATFYELLGIQVDATDKDITTAWRKTVGGIHPDKNRDTAAQECTQAANAAKDVLLDPDKRKIYDRFIQNNPPPPKVDTFDEDFAQSAFDDDNESDDDILQQDDEDSEEDDEENYPLPGRHVQQLHSRVTPYIKAFFRDVEGAIDFACLHRIDQINSQIEKENYNRRRPVLTMYQVPRRWLLFFQYAQRRIIMSFETELFTTERAQTEIVWLREYFARTCQRGLYRWPMTWARLLMDPLHQKLELLGMSRQSPILRATSNDDDIEMEDIDEEIEEGAEGNHRQHTSRPLRPGFTSTGDPILGYIPLQRRVMAGELLVLGFKFFIKVDGINPFKMASGSEVGDAAAFAYHQLPEDKKNNIQENAAKYATMAPAEFVQILGVTWVPGTASTSPRRLPTTYIWVETRTYSGKPNIMTRTTLRQWLGARSADQRVDSWFVTNGITPEWTVSDPANDPRHLRLTYPRPERSSNYNLRSRMQIPPSRGDSEIEELSRRLDQLVGLFARGQEEAREDRRLQREIMNRLLPASSSRA
ncbi:hypothetical protein F5Y01DRAFT_322781 [Xylaria sp. FL0043]|nr:hypothetical protein F5Y01DRAFT_322781 [Xylaria sp. FL0043]